MTGDPLSPRGDAELGRILPDPLTGARLPTQGRIDPRLTLIEPLNSLNLSEALEVGRRAFIYKGEYEGLEGEYTQFASGELTFIDLTEKKETTLVNYAVLKVEGKVAAAGGLYRNPETPSHELSVGWFAVDPAYHKQGLGSLLMAHLEEFAGREGIQEISVYCIENDDNYPGASKLYLRGGYIPTEDTVTYKFETYSGDVVPVLWRKYRKSLSPTQ